MYPKLMDIPNVVVDRISFPPDLPDLSLCEQTAAGKMLPTGHLYVGGRRPEHIKHGKKEVLRPPPRPPHLHTGKLHRGGATMRGQEWGGWRRGWGVVTGRGVW